MLRRNYSIIIFFTVCAQVVINVVGILVVLLSDRQLANAETLSNQQQQQHQSTPSLLLGTKFWIRDTEFGERDNWLNGIKPCSLLERIRVNEQSVVSMGDTFDALYGALESNIKDLSLAMNGMLLLEEDTISEMLGTDLVRSLNASGDCLDGETITPTKALSYHDSSLHDKDHIFEFQPDSDEMSWFNPDNWVSGLELTAPNLAAVILGPDSHKIPCSEDVVVFGATHMNLEQTPESNKGDKTMSFKVNFRASRELSDALLKSNIRVNSLRVARLMIGNQFYSQEEFGQLINSEEYENLLFEFNSSQNILKAEDGFEYQLQSLLHIDESSLQTVSGEEVCSDAAGCLCGNEEVNIMKAICSFHHPIDVTEQPCYDPIISTGYCNKICATVIAISMDPAKFNEEFISNTHNKILQNEVVASSFAGAVFCSSRRIGYNKYEITCRHTFAETEGGGSSYTTTLGKDAEYANLVYQELNKASSRSFYGIKSISIKSSIEWRIGNRRIVFWMWFAIFGLTSVFFFAYLEDYNKRFSSEKSLRYLIQQTEDWVVNTSRRLIGMRRSARDETELFVRRSESNVIDAPDAQISNQSENAVPIIDLETLRDTATAATVKLDF